MEAFNTVDIRYGNATLHLQSVYRVTRLLVTRVDVIFTERLVHRLVRKLRRIERESHLNCEKTPAHSGKDRAAARSVSSSFETGRFVMGGSSSIARALIFQIRGLGSNPSFRIVSIARLLEF
jgi:hypothetical protein